MVNFANTSQPRIWKQSLNEKHSRPGWPVGHVCGICLLLTDLGRPCPFLEAPISRQGLLSSTAKEGAN